MSLGRREFLQLSGMASAAFTLPGLPPLARQLPLAARVFPEAGASGAPPWRGFATSLTEEHDYEAEVEGELPPELVGSLYRNGPGLFERGDLRKRSILDGDGMMHSSPWAAGARATETASSARRSSRTRRPRGSTSTPRGALRRRAVCSRTFSEAQCRTRPASRSW